MADISVQQDEGPSLMPFSCVTCRQRKLRCDRLAPGCTRCGNSGEECRYPVKRKKSSITMTRPRVRELEARVVELEHRLKASRTEGESQESHSSPSSLESELIGTGRFEQLPPQPLIEELTNIYFTKLHSEAPMIHPSRYLTSLYLPAHMQPPMCLQYAVMAVAAALSPAYSQLAQAFYRRARHYLEEDEMKGEGQNFVTLAHAQCWVLLGMFEAQSLWFSRASMSTSRAVRLSQILGLHDLDGIPKLGPTTPPPKDWCEQEERRRTVWTIFCMDRDTSSTTGWPHLMDPGKIQALLPASEDAVEVGIEEDSITLDDALSHGATTRRSAFACRVLAVHLFHECLDHTYGSQTDLAAENDDADSVFWKRHRDLDNGLSIAFVTLPGALKCPPNTQSRDAILINLQLYTAVICLHRSGAARARKHHLNTSLLDATQSRLLPAAQGIFAIMATLKDVDAMFRNPLVAFAAYMSAYVFLEDYCESQNHPSEDKLSSLLDLMIAIGHRNPVTASLAVQMAHELKKTGINPSAMDKVQDLLMSVQIQGPLLAKQNAARAVIFCPFEIPMEDAIPGGVPAAYPTNTPVWKPT